MKFKDIKKNLKDEQNGTDVPDVYTRAKRAPLNKLLDGETPIRAFQSELANWLLIAVSVIFIVVTVAVSAMWISPSSAKSMPDCYACITVHRASGDLRIGVLTRADESRFCIVTEMEDGRVSLTPKVSYSARIEDIIIPEEGDTVSLGVLCDSVLRGVEYARDLVEDMQLLFDNDGVVVSSQFSNDHQIKMQLVSYVNAIGGEVGISYSVTDILKAYVLLF